MGLCVWGFFVCLFEVGREKFVCFGVCMFVSVFCCCFLFGLGLVFSGFCVILGGFGGVRLRGMVVSNSSRSTVLLECVKDKMITAILFN